MSKTKIDVEKGKVRRGLVEMRDTLKYKYSEQRKKSEFYKSHDSRKEAKFNDNVKDTISEIDNVYDTHIPVSLVNIKPTIKLKKNE